MAKGSRGRHRIASRQYRSAPYPLRFDQEIMEDLRPKKCSQLLEKKDWEDVTCSVCMEYPHNAVLLLCSSHDKGCRPYMCGTSCRYSNCLDQYKKAYTKVISSNHGQSLHGSVDNPIVIQDSSSGIEKREVTELACPLCRGQVKGWTVVEPAREYLNAKKRSCMQDNCSFLGNYKELRRHVRAEHPSARPREVDPALEQKWRRLERERERNDVISTITSTMPGAMFFGDYVIEGNNYGFDSDEEGGFDAAGATERNGGFEMGFDSNLVNVFLLLHAFGPSGGDEFNRRMPQPRMPFHQTVNSSAIGIRHTTPVGGAESSDPDDDNEDGHDDDVGGGNGDLSLASRLRRQGRVLLGRSGRRRRRRDMSGGLR
ncbi:Zinc finger, RING/FYVE/PHD-type [Trema orientale]|uniref:Zinc finger, RING/FYVE/PHD-type n=1 Tax=Trema orientale TaxID=63057 RepID=A0A2P5BDB5_TREOI|nr:Zinc finger, RING/FYVE/PHD-type [Trema orientale]